jgi:hypothetical protein
MDPIQQEPKKKKIIKKVTKKIIKKVSGENVSDKQSETSSAVDVISERGGKEF